MVVVTPGIPGNPPTWLTVVDWQSRIGGKGARGIVIEQAYDGALDSRHGSLRIGTPGIHEVLHLSGVTAGKPLGHFLKLGKLSRAHAAAEVEAQSIRLVHDPMRIGEQCHPRDCAARSEERRVGKEWSTGGRTEESKQQE